MEGAGGRHRRRSRRLLRIGAGFSIRDRRFSLPKSLNLSRFYGRGLRLAALLVCLSQLLI